MNIFFSVSLTALVIPLMSPTCQEVIAQDPQAGQTQQGFIQTIPASSSAPQSATTEQDEMEARIQANLAKLGRDDQQLAAAQGFCPIMTKNRLGKMGTPAKVSIKNQPVFVCCAGCQKKALASPDKTLATVAALKVKMAEAEISASLAKLSPEDRRLAESQGFCPVMADNRLGVMGTPVKVMVKDQPVFLCCGGCKRKTLVNPDQTLAIVAGLRAKVAKAAASKPTTEANSTTR